MELSSECKKWLRCAYVGIEDFLFFSILSLSGLVHASEVFVCICFFKLPCAFAAGGFCIHCKCLYV